MNVGLRYRIALTVLVALLGIIYVLPSLPGVRQSAIGKILPSNEINLGLDLKGGIHLTLGVDLPKAMENSLAQMGQDIRAFAKEEEIVILQPRVAGGDRLEFTLAKADKREAMDNIIAKHFGSSLTVQSKRDLGDGRVQYLLSMQPEYRKYLENMTLDQAVKTIRNRIDQFGVAEPDIRRQQGGRVQVQLPGLQDPERAIQIIGKTAHLEFKIVDDEADTAKAVKGILPPGSELSTIRNRQPGGGYSDQPIVVRKDAVLTGEAIADANMSIDSNNQAYVSLSFNSRGAKLFERITTDNVKKRMAIVLDGKVYSAPVIQEKISGGRASITGHFTRDEARDLAIVLRAGALPAPVNIMEQRTVGPSLGQESIDKGLMAGFIGAAAIFIFMAVYYGIGGLIADAALILNVILLMGGLAIFGATLTLPGIAGIILTVGIAVDSSVIIYERIREELRRGMTPRAAVDQGYEHATLTIFDANLTNIIIAVILYQFGTGPVRGFAVTLILGLIISMFTAIFVTRIIFDMWISRLKPGSALSI